MTNDALEPKKWDTAEEQEHPGVTEPELIPDSKPFPLTRVVIASGGLLALAGLVYVLFFLPLKPPAIAKPGAAAAVPGAQPGNPVTPPPVTVKDTRPAIVALSVPLQESDEAVRQKAAAITANGRLGKLLTEHDFIRRFVAVCSAIALGESPAKMLESLAPKLGMGVLAREGRLYVDPASYRRYDPLVQLLLSLDADKCAELYLVFEPQIEEASRELGNEPSSFIKVLQEAVNQLRRTPVPPESPELLEKTISFAYTDSKLENLNASQKHFLRLGPQRLRQLQEKTGRLLSTLLARKGI